MDISPKKTYRWLANRHMKRCSVTNHQEKSQWATTSHLSEWLSSKKTTNNNCWWEYGEKGTLEHYWSVSWCTHCGKQHEGSFKIKTEPLGFLVVQWLRVHLAMQGTWVPSLVHEDPTCHRQLSLCAAPTEAWMPRAHAPPPVSHRSEKPVHHN